ncbi:conserved hypothetical protein [Ricinus communis]|uniref:Uncharacterized protein n=1 Tax=Ricinus communis TaxID=3988 RepID=B9T660_RICCO|nr:conserved hypothetical protein [Ricinus communis]
MLQREREREAGSLDADRESTDELDSDNRWRATNGGKNSSRNFGNQSFKTTTLLLPRR